MYILIIKKKNTTIKLNHKEIDIGQNECLNVFFTNKQQWDFLNINIF